MSGPLEYPLQQILKIKEQRFEQAQKLLKQRREELVLEEKKLKKAEEARDKVLAHQQAKIEQMFAEYEKGTTSEKILQMKRYLEVVKEKLAEENRKVAEQEEQVRIAEENVVLARQEMMIRRTAVDKMELHKKQWTMEAKEEIRKAQEKEQDEIGNILFLKNRDKWS